MKPRCLDGIGGEEGDQRDQKKDYTSIAKIQLQLHEGVLA